MVVMPSLATKRNISNIKAKWCCQTKIITKQKSGQVWYKSASNQQGIGKEDLDAATQCKKHMMLHTTTTPMLELNLHESAMHVHASQ